jgi:CheY-like chemotaxis protein
MTYQYKDGGKEMRKLNKILLVDDDEACNFLHQDLLETLQAATEVITCTSAKEAWEWLQQTKPDLLLLDINMPVMTGLEFLEQLYPVEARSCPVVLLSSSGHTRDVMKAADLKVDYYLLKPLTPESLQRLWQDVFY